ncbi:UNVERIFIED_CONTAM: hypothetical protein GTU68_049025 [Idotea baltica]|nr:hypothetical protein [Idotea baltica]
MTVSSLNQWQPRKPPLAESCSLMPLKKNLSAAPSSLSDQNFRFPLATKLSSASTAELKSKSMAKTSRFFANQTS